MAQVTSEGLIGYGENLGIGVKLGNRKDIRTGGGATQRLQGIKVNPKEDRPPAISAVVFTWGPTRTGWHANKQTRECNKARW